MFWQSDKDDKKTFAVLVHIDAKKYRRFGSDRLLSLRSANTPGHQYNFQSQQTNDGQQSTNSALDSPHQRQESNFPVAEETPKRRNGSNKSNSGNVYYSDRADHNSSYTSLLMPVLKTPLRSEPGIGQGQPSDMYCKEVNQLVSCVEGDHSNYDGYDTDGDSISSIEHFEPTNMQIEKRNGVINLICKKLDDGENQEEDEDGDMLEAKGQQNINHSKREIDTSLSPPSRVQSVEDGLNLQESNHSVKSIVTRSVITRLNESTPFELTSTKNQTHKDCKQKEFNQIRKSCLDVAAEAYKGAGAEIPDIILAQINDHRSSLIAKLNINSSILDSFLGNIPTSSNTSLTSSGVSSRAPVEPSFIKKITLKTTDEIHVAPCQCVLRLVGMKERKGSFDLANIFGISGLSSNQNPKAETKIYDDDGGSDSKLMNAEFSSMENTMKSKLVRTCSAVASSKRDDAEELNSIPASPLNKKRSKTVHFKKNEKIAHGKEHFVHNRSESNSFTGVGYHEITLIRNCSNAIHDDENDQDYLEWEAITIRCSNHDELDALVKELKDSSKAKVVPFSSNPKERLRKIREEKKAAARRNITSSTSSASIEKHIFQNTPLISNATQGQMDQVITRKTDDQSSDEDEYEECLDLSSLGDAKENQDPQKDSTFFKSSKQKEKVKIVPWDLNFNKKDYCELCELTFTLLTRRHHCRKCEKSCCGHCSRLLIVQGCDEKRYCNRCSVDILAKQAAALRGRKNKSRQESILPGKVHEMCKNLGVGVIGKLPHWKTYLRRDSEQRPAVGRLTVEVIEAVALPSVDLLNGNVDPYVRATITGYDRDLRWSLRQWLSSKRYSINSRFCSSTLSPVWRGVGRKGGELLTLPVISTAGAVLRLEVLHYNVLTSSRGKDAVLGFVEIPLSDLPNANLRDPDGIAIRTPDGRRKNITFDGYIDRWYRLALKDEKNRNSIILSKPVALPDLMVKEKRRDRTVAWDSLEEVGKKAQALCIAPVEWFAQAIKLDLPAKKPEAIYKGHESRSMIHVRIKLNASVFGDAISHSFVPPIRMLPLPPPYDPEILYARIVRVGKELKPFQRIQKYIEKCIKWKHEPKVCIRAYVIFAVHLAIFPQLLKIFHVYLFIFLGIQLKQMIAAREIENQQQMSFSASDSLEGIQPSLSQESFDNIQDEQEPNDDSLGLQDSPSLSHFNNQQNSNPVQNAQYAVDSSSNDLVVGSPQNDITTKSKADDGKNEEVTKLNIAVSWIARRLGKNKRLEVLQFKLAFLARDLGRINSIWNGKNPLWTKIAMAILVPSFVLHLIFNQRMLWFIGTFIWYFSMSPHVKIAARSFFGIWRGLAKVTRRQHLLDAEISEVFFD